MRSLKSLEIIVLLIGIFATAARARAQQLNGSIGQLTIGVNGSSSQYVYNSPTTVSVNSPVAVMITLSSGASAAAINCSGSEGSGFQIGAGNNTSGTQSFSTTWTPTAPGTYTLQCTAYFYGWYGHPSSVTTATGTIIVQ